MSTQSKISENVYYLLASLRQLAPLLQGLPLQVQQVQPPQQQVQIHRAWLLPRQQVLRLQASPQEQDLLPHQQRPEEEVVTT